MSTFPTVRGSTSQNVTRPFTWLPPTSFGHPRSATDVLLILLATSTPPSRPSPNSPHPHSSILPPLSSTHSALCHSQSRDSPTVFLRSRSLYAPIAERVCISSLVFSNHPLIGETSLVSPH
ncbi:hypothetical protein RHS01_05657 [Rhizoctonia solani]|uniref:Uncharacterized protein n=1 Tax=Rhizoctonia solani TaxID=456999 RepID=A0A8H7IC29_9AGAM|nr:hypothetical protein RHS01_05657 [Rhizoctonia solani]